MGDLLERVLEAHGGLDRWRQFSRVRTTIVSGGELWGIKGLVQDATPRQMTVTLHHEWASVTPFGAPDQRTDFTPDRIAIEKLDGQVVAERKDPRAAFAGHDLTTPFLLALPGVSVTEIAPVREDGEEWAGLQADFPAEIATHSRLQEFYFGPDHLIRRHDYRVDVAGSFPAAQYVGDIVEADGLRLPTRRRAYLADSDGRPIREQLMVSIDLSDIHFERSGAVGDGAVGRQGVEP